MASTPDIPEVPHYILVILARQLNNFFTGHEQGRNLKGSNRVGTGAAGFSLLPSASRTRM